MNQHFQESHTHTQETREMDLKGKGEVRKEQQRKADRLGLSQPRVVNSLSYSPSSYSSSYVYFLNSLIEE